MSSDQKHKHRTQTLGEEIANSISHGIGFLGALVVTPFLIIAAIPKGASGVIGASIFGTTMMLLYLASTLYHAFPQSKAKRVFKIFDHSGIFLLIAGTYLYAFHTNRASHGLGVDALCDCLVAGHSRCRIEIGERSENKLDFYCTIFGYGLDSSSGSKTLVG